MGDESERQLPWGMNQNRISQSSRASLTAEKVKGFTIGAQSKSKYQKQKEELEARKRKEEEDAAKVFEDFVASFEGEGGEGRGNHGKGKSGGFVRGDVVNSGGKGGSDSKGSIYQMTPKVSLSQFDTKPSSQKSIDSKPILSSSNLGSPVSGFGAPRPSHLSYDTPASRAVEAEKKEKKQPKRSIDALMEEFKNQQSGGGSGKSRRTDGPSEGSGGYRSRIEEASVGVRSGADGSFDEGDPETTNLYVGNLHPQVTEEVLMREFGPFGPIASVKVMWPRTEEERRRSRNCGFVNMMNRADAEKAKEAMNARELLGLEIRIGWGKALPKPPVPCYVHTDTLASCKGTIATEVAVHFPADKDLRRLIDKTAEYVAREGHEFERAIIDRERDNPDFDFLWEPQSREGMYYKWRVYAFCQSDTAAEWRRSAFKMFLGGVTWLPPVDDQDSERRSRSPSPSRESKAAASSRSHGSKSSHRRREQLTDNERDIFEDMLRSLTAERDSIGDAMVFALGRAEAAKEVVEVLTESLCILQTPIPAKIARLYLVSDILHNSSAAVAKASLFRSLFESSMTSIFEALGEKLKATEGRITAQAMKDKVSRVLRVWEVWSLYPQDFIAKLECLFLGRAPEADLGGSEDGRDLDGVSLDEDVDGVPLDEGGMEVGAGDKAEGDKAEGARPDEDVDGEAQARP